MWLGPSVERRKEVRGLTRLVGTLSEPRPTMVEEVSLSMLMLTQVAWFVNLTEVIFFLSTLSLLTL